MRDTKLRAWAWALGLLLLPPAAEGQGVRKPVWAGQFYDARPEQLSRQLDDMLGGAGSRAAPAPGLAALIVPHAGYVYSGPVAAHAYSLIQGADIETVVIVGVAHRHGFQGASIYPSGGYATPLHRNPPLPGGIPSILAAAREALRYPAGRRAPGPSGRPVR